MPALFAGRVRPFPWWILVPIGIAGCGEETTSAPPGLAPKVASAPASIPSPATAPKVGASSQPGPLRFEDVAEGAGIDFIQVSGMTEYRHFPSANGSGVAIFDHDGDGKMDLYFATCNYLPLEAKPKESNRLYKNLGGGKFRDVTEASGLGFRGFCHGIVVGDVDNDGDQDVFLCNLGPNVLYLNNGDGTFRDVSHEAGIDKSNWSSGGAFLDYDNDGDLDLYVANYGSWDIKADGERPCGQKTPDGKTFVRQYCSPRTIRTVPHLLYCNDAPPGGIPHFAEVAEAAGVSRKEKEGGHGFGVVASDLNGDGKIDLYVANDQTPAFTFLNNGDGTFNDVSEQCGAAFAEDGNAQSGMGADAEDVDGDGLPELVRTNFQKETTSYYQNLGKGQFMEQSRSVGILKPSMPWVKWGCGLIDFDADGYLDLVVTNGHVDDNLGLVGRDEPYGQPPSLFHNVEAKKGPHARGFVPVEKGAGAYFASPHVGRGLAWGDLDDDGLPDLVINHKDSRPAVLLNRSRPRGHWLRVDLVGSRSNRDGIGAKVEVVADGRKILRQRKGGGSMESAHDPRLSIGVGAATKVSVRVAWPSGAVSTIPEVETDRAIRIQEVEAPNGGPKA